MKKHFLFFAFFVTIIGISSLAGNVSETEMQAREWTKNKSVKFRENKGQWADKNILFQTEAPGMQMCVTEKGLTYFFVHTKKENENEQENIFEKEKMETEWSRVDMELANARILKENIVKENQSEYFNQYFFPNGPRGITDVRDYEKITVKNIYPGIDWVLYNSSNAGFKYDFIVHPGANASDILLTYRSKNKLKLNDAGNISLITKF